MLISDETRLFRDTESGTCYRIQFHTDDDAPNPWEDWDGQTPLLVHAGRGGDSDYSQGCNVRDPFPYLSARKLRQVLPEYLEKVRRVWAYRTLAEFDQAARNYSPGAPLDDARRALLQSDLADRDFTGQALLEGLACLWKGAGVPALFCESHGYSQGDWAALLFVAHPDALEGWGFTGKDWRARVRSYLKAHREPGERSGSAHMKADRDLFGAYLWGGVVGWEVAQIDSREVALCIERGDFDALESATPAGLDALRYCHHVDSCWGYFPDGSQHYFPLATSHAYAIGEAESAAKADAEGRARVAA
jgi:hypothetical protein